MKTLKVISITSFLLICTIHENSVPIFLYILMAFVDFFNSFMYNNLGINWEACAILFLVLGTLIIFSSYKKFKNGYLMILCFISLLMILISETGILDSNNYIRISYEFIVPLMIFIVSSIILIFKVFSKKE